MSKKTIIIICVCVGLIFIVFAGIMMMSMGIMVHNTVSNANEETIEDIRNSTTELYGIEAIDSQVREYEGEKLEYLIVHVVISKIKLCNENTETEKIKVEYKSKTGLSDMIATSESSELRKMQELLNKEQKYKIAISKCNEDGLISTITIIEI